MTEDLGPIVIDPHAFRPLWPALGVWLALFLTAGDARTVVPRQFVLAFGAPAEARVAGKSRASVPALLGRERRYYIEFSYEAGGSRGKGSEPVGPTRWSAVPVGSRRAIHVRGGMAFLDDDLGYSRWKLGMFGGAFIALWLWAAARYRFG